MRITPLLLLVSMISGLFVVGATHAQKTYAAAAALPPYEVYPEPTTLYNVPVPPGENRNWTTPYAITVGSDNNLWFTEFSDDHIGRVTPDGSVTQYALPAPSGQYPTAIAAGPGGNIWFVERYGSYYGYITPAGAITEFADGPYVSDPKGLVEGPDGNLWFAAIGYIGSITPEGEMTIFASPVGSPTGITVGPDGKLWYAGSGGIGVTTTAGVSTSFSLNSPYSTAYGLTLGPDGNLWFTEQGGYGQDAIGRITPKGVITDFPVPEVQFPDNTTWPTDVSIITAGPDGNLWFAANTQSLFGQITPDGTVTLYLPADASSFGGTTPTSMVAGPNGNLWFTEAAYVGYLAVGGGTTPTPTPTITPSPTPVVAPQPVDYIRAANAAYGLDKGTFTPPPGMKKLLQSPSDEAKDGFEAVALEDQHGNIIIANEGTVLPFSLHLKPPFVGSPFERGSVAADIKIQQDQTPAALVDAIDFSRAVEAAYGHKIYVTGHSLGGIEAEAEAKDLGTNFAEGATFGATGLPGNTTSGGSPYLTNYVDYGDPVGNYASDDQCALHSQTAGLMYHYGPVDMVGKPRAALFLQVAVVQQEAYLELPESVRYADDGGEVAMGLDLMGSLYFHKIEHYAGDLYVSLQPGAQITPAATPDEVLGTLDDTLGTPGLANTEAATVQSDGTITTPDLTIKVDSATGNLIITDTTNVSEPWGTEDKGGVTTLTVNPQSEQITSEKYAAPDSSTFTSSLNASDSVTVIAANLKNNGSYQVFYMPSNNKWRSVTTFYSQANLKGTVTETVTNWPAGGSQVILYTGLPKGYHEEIESYTGPNGTGTLLNKVYF